MFSHQVVARNDKTSDDQKLISRLQEMVKNILENKDDDQAKKSIDMEAYVVDGKYFESLVDAVRGKSGNCRLIEGADSKMVFQTLNITDDQTAAFMVMKTQSPKLGERFHSVVFFKEAEGEWKTKSWHISN
jgi:hypothetical protein